MENRGRECPLSGGRNHLSCDPTVSFRDRLLPPSRCSLAELVERACWYVIRPRQVVVRDLGQVDDAVVFIVATAFVRRLVEGRANVEVRAGDDPLLGGLWRAGLTADRPVLLLVGLMKMLGAEVLALQVRELPRGVGEALEHREDLLAVDDGQARLAWGRSRRVIEAGEER